MEDLRGVGLVLDRGGAGAFAWLARAPACSPVAGAAGASAAPSSASSSPVTVACESGSSRSWVTFCVSGEM